MPFKPLRKDEVGILEAAYCLNIFTELYLCINEASLEKDSVRLRPHPFESRFLSLDTIQRETLEY